MKRTLTITLLLLAVVFAAGCKRHKIIPDNELGKIFHDALLVNSYINQHMPDVDSLNIYEPIFASYGYTTDDVRYTIANFSRRKSARLGDVAEHMILLLDRETREFDRKVTVLDTIDNAARRFATQRIFADSAIRARTLADTAKLQVFAWHTLGEGQYTVTARYTLDSLDRAGGRRIRVEWILPDSSRRLATGAAVHRTRDSKFTQTIMVSKENADKYIGIAFNFAHFGVVERKNPPLTRMDVHEVTVDYVPPTEQAVEELFRHQAKLRIFSDTTVQAVEARAREAAQR